MSENESPESLSSPAPDYQTLIQSQSGSVKPGVRTTEFWVVAIVLLVVVLQGLADVIPGTAAAVCATLAGVVYAGARAYLKAQAASNAAEMEELYAELSEARRTLQENWSTRGPAEKEVQP